MAVPVDVREVHVDASGVRDDTTTTPNLQVRWDFQDDGIWDTDFDVVKTADFVYPDNGDYTIRMQVRDNIGQVASTTRPVRFVDQLVVFGDIDSQVWFGLVRVTGDVRVRPAPEWVEIRSATMPARPNAVRCRPLPKTERTKWPSPE